MAERDRPARSVSGGSLSAGATESATASAWSSRTVGSTGTIRRTTSTTAIAECCTFFLVQFRQFVFGDHAVAICVGALKQGREAFVGQLLFGELLIVVSVKREEPRNE